MNHHFFAGFIIGVGIGLIIVDLFLLYWRSKNRRKRGKS